MRPTLIASVTDANLGIVDGRAFLDDTVNVSHCARVIHELVERRIGIEEILDNQRGSLLMAALDIIAPLFIVVILGPPSYNFV